MTRVHRISQINEFQYSFVTPENIIWQFSTCRVTCKLNDSVPCSQLFSVKHFSISITPTEKKLILRLTTSLHDSL